MKSGENGETSEKYLNETITDHRQSSFSAFLEVFFDAIQLDSDENDKILSEQEAEVLRSIMNSSGIIGVSENDTHTTSQPKEEFAINLIDQLKTKSMSGQSYPDEYEIDWKTSHTGTRFSIWIETLRMRKNIKVLDYPPSSAARQPNLVASNPSDIGKPGFLMMQTKGDFDQIWQCKEATR